MVLDQHEMSVSLGEEVRQKIRKALLKQHHHQNQKKLANRIPIVRSFADIGRKQSEPHSMDKNGTAPHAPANALFCFSHASVLSSFLMVSVCVSQLSSRPNRPPVPSPLSGLGSATVWETDRCSYVQPRPSAIPSVCQLPINPIHPFLPILPLTAPTSGPKNPAFPSAND